MSLSNLILPENFVPKTREGESSQDAQVRARDCFSRLEEQILFGENEAAIKEQLVARMREDASFSTGDVGPFLSKMRKTIAEVMATPTLIAGQSLGLSSDLDDDSTLVEHFASERERKDEAVIAEMNGILQRGAKPKPAAPATPAPVEPIFPIFGLDD